MFFENEFVSPYCGAKKMFYVYGRTNPSQRFAVFTSKYRPAKDWRIVNNNVEVSMYCDKCCKTRSALYKFDGTRIGEWK